MNNGLIALKLFLQELDIEFDIDNMDKRKLLQKAVYLGQLTGVDLGYRFSWYIKGPYCPSLTRDYYSLAKNLKLDKKDFTGKAFKPKVSDQLKKIVPLLSVPESLEDKLSQENWLELIASLHYLIKFSGYPWEKAKSFLIKEKPHFKSLVSIAHEFLKKNSVLLKLS